MDSWDRFEETNLPPKGAFYSALSMSGVSETDYEHARKVWRELWFKNMGEYHDLYLKTDVILLANVFEAFKNVCLNNYGLDLAKLLYCPRAGMESISEENGNMSRATIGSRYVTNV